MSADTLATSGEFSESPSRARRLLGWVGWLSLAFILMIVFTVLKLPEERVRNFIHGSIASALSAQNMGYTAGQEKLAIGFGVSYVMKDVTLSLPPPAEAVHIDEVTVAPAILPMILGKMGGKAWIRNGSGAISASFSLKKNDLSLEIDSKAMDLGKLGLVAALAGVKASALLNGTAELKGDLTSPSGLEGRIQLDLSNLVVDAQSVMGFGIPRIAVSEGKIDVLIEKSKASIRTLRLGKTGNAADDLKATLTGEVVLAKQWPASTLNVKAAFELSQNLMKGLNLPIDLILGGGKQPDGSYAYNLTGPVTSPTATPVPAGAR